MASAFVTLMRFKSKQHSKQHSKQTKKQLTNARQPALTLRRSSSSNTVTPIMVKTTDIADDTELEVGRCWKQQLVRERYESNLVQILVAVLIFSNFIVSAIEAQLLPQPGSDMGSAFLVFEWFFGLIFALELLWNMYGSWWYQFWESGWNIFDFVIVLISLLSLGMSNLPGISVLRLFRAFRVFRLFKRVPSLRIIIEGVVASMPGVSNAFVVVILLMGIWAIMGVEFFGAATPQHFGDFFKAMFTMWQVMTMDSWASGVGRALIFDHDMWMASVFFVSFTFICGIIMTNVVVAILLEKYLDATNKENQPANSPNSSRQSSRRNSDAGSRHRKSSTASASSSPQNEIDEIDMQVAHVSGDISQHADSTHYLQLVLQRLDTLTDDVRLIKHQQQQLNQRQFNSPTAVVISQKLPPDASLQFQKPLPYSMV